MDKPVTFFEDLVGFSNFSQFTELKHYSPLPSDWFVVITDIENSTQAIQDGKYREVNSVSTASMIAVHNVFDSTQLPYVFGGDGATLCIPPTRLDAVKSALAASRDLANQSFGLKLRVGLVPVKVILDKNLQVLVAKYQPSAQFCQAMFQGNGFEYAEDLVKAPSPNNPYLLAEDTVAKGSFEGFECRWQEIPSPNEEIVSIIIKSLDQDEETKRSAYVDIVNRIADIYGSEHDIHPLRLQKLSLTFSLKKLWIEASIRTQSKEILPRMKYVCKLTYLALLGKLFMSKGVKYEGADWGMYKRNLIENTDYKKFDETLKMVICGTRDQREALVSYLDEQHGKGKIAYGIHASPSAIVTCKIIDYEENHMHFLDGSDGGYAMAAKMLKLQLAKLNEK